MSDTAVRRQMLVEEIEKALETPEISKVLDREDSHAPSVDYLRQRTLSELNVENPTFHPALEEYLASRRRAFPARDQQTRWFPFTPTPTLDRWLATAAAIGVALAFIRGHSGLYGASMNIPLGYAAISIISLSVLVPALPIAQLSKARRIVGQSLFLAAGSAGVLAAAVSFHEVEEQELARRGSASALILVAGTICFAAIALTFIRRRADPKEVPPQISVPPLRFDPAPALIVMVGGLLALAVIFTLSSGQGRVISIANPNAFIWPSLLALGVAAMHSVLTFFYSRAIICWTISRELKH